MLRHRLFSFRLINIVSNERGLKHMDNIKRYVIIAKRNKIGNEMYIFGVIQGLLTGICDLNSGTLIWGCELFQDFCIYTADTTQQHFDKFRSIVEEIYPGLCEFSTTREES